MSCKNKDKAIQTLKIETRIVAQNDPYSVGGTGEWLELKPSSTLHEPVKMRIIDAYHLSAAFYEACKNAGMGDTAGHFHEAINDLLIQAQETALESASPTLINKLKIQGVKEFFDILIPPSRSEEEEKQIVTQQWSGQQLLILYKMYCEGNKLKE